MHFQNDQNINKLLLFQAMLKQHFTEGEAERYLRPNRNQNLSYPPAACSSFFHGRDELGIAGLLPTLYFNSEADIKKLAGQGRTFSKNPYPEVMDYIAHYRKTIAKAREPKDFIVGKAYLMEHSLNSVLGVLEGDSHRFPYFHPTHGIVWSYCTHAASLGQERDWANLHRAASASALEIEDLQSWANYLTKETLPLLIADPDQNVKKIGQELAKALGIPEEAIGFESKSRVESE